MNDIYIYVPGVLPKDAGELLVPVELGLHLAVVVTQPFAGIHAPTLKKNSGAYAGPGSGGANSLNRPP